MYRLSLAARETSTASPLVPSLHSSFPQRSQRSIQRSLISLLTAGVKYLETQLQMHACGVERRSAALID